MTGLVLQRKVDIICQYLCLKLGIGKERMGMWSYGRSSIVETYSSFCVEEHPFAPDFVD